MNILITGGASGLGLDITKALAAGSDADRIYFTYNSSAAAAEKLMAELKNSQAVKCDFRKEEDMVTLTEKITELDIDVLINNAYHGSFIDTYFHKTDGSAFLRQFADNVMPVVKITQAAISHFRKKKSGKIITILTAALAGDPPIGTSVYVANKAYLKELTRIWAAENSRFNISVMSVSPGFMLTGFTSNLDERLIEQMRESHPQKKLLTTAEVASRIAKLCEEKKIINGTDFLLTTSNDCF